MSNMIAAERTGIPLQSERYWVGRRDGGAGISPRGRGASGSAAKSAAVLGV